MGRKDIFTSDEKWTIKKRFNELPLDQKEAFLKGIINKIEQKKERAEESLKESITYNKRRVLKGIIGGSLGVMAAGIGAMFAGQQLDPTMTTMIAGTVAMGAGSASAMAGTVSSPFFMYKDGEEKINRAIIENAEKAIKQVKKEIKEVQKEQKRGR